jgi:hypothetical protein
VYEIFLFENQFEYKLLFSITASLRRTVVASTLCATKQLNKIPLSSGTLHRQIIEQQSP